MLPAVNDSQNQCLQLMDIDEESDDGILIAIHQAYSVSLGPEEEPKTFNQALNSTDVQYWKAAMLKVEMDALNRNKTWDVVPVPSNRNIVGSKWVYKIKRDSSGNIAKYKAQLVAQGFSQQSGTDFDEIYSLVVRFDSL